MLPSPRLALLPLMLVGALACVRTPSAALTDAEPVRPVEREGDAVTPADGVTVLIDPGAEPRSVLRYHPRVGQVVRWQLIMLTSTKLKILDETMTNHFGIELDSESEVLAVDPANDEYEYRTVFVGARLLSEHQNPAAIEAALAPYLDLEDRSRFNGRGQALEHRYFRNGAPVDPRTIEGLEDPVSAMIFPEEPIGLDGRWLKYDEVERNGFRVLQRSEHRLVRRSGDQIEIETTVTQEPLATVMRTKDMPADSRVELQRFVATGSGTSTHDLGFAIPLRAQVRVELDMGARIYAGGEQAEMTAQMTLESIVSRIR